MLYFQTTNRHKFDEAKEILAGYGIEVEHIPTGYTEIQAPRPEEVVEEALRGIQRGNVFVEDSGLFVKKLRGFPGVYSAHTLEAIGLGGVLKLMEGIEDRRAEFVSVIGLNAGGVKIFKGAVRGSISLEARGEAGFGYDPIFVPEGSEKTFAEDIKLKKEISHRRRALEKLAKYVGEDQ